MILHLLKLIWNRKRANALIVAELLLSFLVLAGVTTVAVHFWRNYQSPLGFSHERIWDVVVRVPEGMKTTPEEKRERLAAFVRLLDAVREMPEVEAVSHIGQPAYRNWQWSSDFTLTDDRLVAFDENRGGDDLASTMSIGLVDGRWFSREDNGQRQDPVVVNAALARAIFGTEQAAGRTIPVKDDGHRDGDPTAVVRERRVVGVIEDFRQFGEYNTPGNYLFVRNDIASAAAADVPAGDGPQDPVFSSASVPSAIVVRVRPGVTGEFEERLVHTLQTLAPNWGFAMKPSSETRVDYLRSNYVTPLAIVALVAGFLLVMVALGLSGVLWQNVTQRIRELGLRRAKGADRARIRRQILTEIVLMTGIAIAFGLLLLAQVPMLGWLGPIPTSVFAASLVLAAALLTAMTAFCGWYPSLLATRVPPAEALRYE